MAACIGLEPELLFSCGVEPEAKAEAKAQEAKIATVWSKGAQGWSLTTATPASSKPTPVWTKQPSGAEPGWNLTAAAEPTPWRVGDLLHMASDFVDVLSAGGNKSLRWLKCDAGWKLTAAAPVQSKPHTVTWIKQRTDVTGSEWNLRVEP